MVDVRSCFLAHLNTVCGYLCYSDMHFKIATLVRSPGVTAEIFHKMLFLFSVVSLWMNVQLHLHQVKHRQHISWTPPQIHLDYFSKIVNNATKWGQVRLMAISGLVHYSLKSRWWVTWSVRDRKSLFFKSETNYFTHFWHEKIDFVSCVCQ